MIMKFILSVLSIATLSFALCLFLPWWVIAVVGFVVSVFIKQSSGASFLAGFTALFLLWGAIAAFISSSNENIFAHKISVLILKIDSPVYIIITTALIGALVAGFGSLTGSFIGSKK